MLAGACGGDSAPPDPPEGDPPEFRPRAAGDEDRDVHHTSLSVDVGAMSATAAITVAADPSRGLTLEVGDLAIDAVYDDHGPLNYTTSGKNLVVGIPDTKKEHTLSVDYRYSAHNDFDGVMESGTTLTWPYYCGNVFPCRSAPSDGLTFALSLTGVSGTAVYPEAIPGQSPAYMLAWAIGDYTYRNLGTTTSGTEVGVYYLSGGETDAIDGTANLLAAFTWMEETIGPYPFGNKVASVAADWGFGAFGGMEHHPLWHVATGAMDDEETHAHEAAHGWFGNGVRLACWEDFVLSEGTVSYLAARSLTVVAGDVVGTEIWDSYSRRLNNLQISGENKIAWPEGCNQLDILADGLFGTAPYMKGAFFFKALAERIGADEVDRILGLFYQANREKATTMQSLLDIISSESGYDPTECAQSWLRSATPPQATSCP
jgi:hypothetical protein